MPDLAALNAGDLELVAHAALEQRDMRAVHAALTVLAVRDPHRAQQLLDLIQMALVVSDARPADTTQED